VVVTSWTLEYYETPAGRRPVQDYLDGLEAREALRVSDSLELLEDRGTALGAPHTRNLGGKLWELRVLGRVQHRVLYFAASGRRLVLLHAFTKKTPKTPPTELETARRRMADYLGRMET